VTKILTILKQRVINIPEMQSNMKSNKTYKRNYRLRNTIMEWRSN